MLGAVILVITFMVQMGSCQRTITKQSMQLSGYTAASTYYNGFYSNIGAIDEDAFEGLVGMQTIDVSFNVIRVLGINRKALPHFISDVLI